ncbi:MAG: MotA/TolQ/ExbB proton channel family protein [Spirochaetia bacterium]|nr:MotA/TolQ/ExbB proton channel family protein [Spirochaetia bacterium]
MKYLPKQSIKTLSYTLILLCAFYLVSPALPQAKDPAPSQEATTTTQENTNTQETKKEEAVPAPKKSPGLVDLFVVGGWSMYPLLLASFVGLGVALERMYFFFANRLVSKGYNQDLADAIDEKGLDGASKFFETHKEDRITQILQNGMEVSSGDPELFVKGIEREAAEVITLLERGLTILASVSTIAPLIGFLGTVSGMINAFDAIANADQVNAKVVAGGIKEALITTAAGLIVAIPAMSFYQILTGKVNGFTTEVEESANRIYKEYLKNQAKKLAGTAK